MGLTDRQAERLKRLAVERNVSVAQLIREAVDEILAEGYIPDREELKRRAAAAAGAFRSDRSDVSTRHDDYLAEAFGS
ncbi:MAG: CopG family transcriptional regulator [Armatimonadetes bacterium]|nr:CopG family transcriptional regulator [Armatimonadota bacterium]